MRHAPVLSPIRVLFALSALVLGLASFATPAAALPKVALSVGQGVFFNNGTHATSFQGELTGSFSFAILQADLGLLQEFNKSKDLMMTPGLRLNLLSFYAKAGVPLRLTGDFDWGFRLGAGWTLFSIGIAGIFVEVDAMFWKSTDFKDYVPITGRAGVELGF